VLPKIPHQAHQKHSENQQGFVWLDGDRWPGGNVPVHNHFFSGRNVETNIDLLPGEVVIVPEPGIFE
jgi:hypothetical protein